MTDAGVVLAAVARARRRIAMHLFATVTSVTLTLAAAAVLALWASGTDVTLGRLVPAAAAVAVVAAAGVTVARAPSAKQTAAILDRRLGLRDRVVAALACGDAVTPMAMLIVRDASVRLQDANLAAVSAFPTRRLLSATGLVVVMAAVAALLEIDPSGSASAAVMGEAGSPLRGGPGLRREVPAPSSSVGRVPAPQVPATTPPTDAPRQAARVDEPRSPAMTTVETSPRATSAAAQPPDRREPTASGRTAASGAPTPNAGRSAGSPRDQAGNAGRGMPASGSDARRRAGGVQRGALSAAADPDGTGATGSPSTADLQRARLHAETAIARQDVPPRLAGYVRSYFRALQSEDRR